MLDIGAHDGTYAEVFAKAVGPTGRVWAVEPHPVSWEAATARLARYPWVTVLHAAVTHVPMVVEFWSDDADRRRSSRWAGNRLADGPMHRVPGQTLDDLVRLMGHVDWIKVDAQGGEADIVTGASDTLEARQASWCLEVWPEGLRAAGATVRDVIEPFTARGYQPWLDRRSYAGRVDELVGLCERKRGHGAADVIFTPVLPGPQAA